jgi:hypothetical protein
MLRGTDSMKLPGAILWMIVLANWCELTAANPRASLMHSPPFQDIRRLGLLRPIADVTPMVRIARNGEQAAPALMPFIEAFR